MRSLTLLFVFLSSLGFARDLGTELSFKLDENKKPGFGVVYTYDKDPDGMFYQVTFSGKTTAANKFQKLRYNFYLASKDKYLLDWSDKRKVFISSFVAFVDDKTKGYEDILKQLLIGQKKIDGKGESFLVLANDKDVPIYHISLSELCASHPKNFSDLTHDRKCDQVSP